MHQIYYGKVYVKVTVSSRQIKEISVYHPDREMQQLQYIWMNSLITGNNPLNPARTTPDERKDFEVNSSLVKKEGPHYNSGQEFADAIVTNQSTVIDVMSGATQTCEGIIEAVHYALMGKNGDVVSAWEQEGKQKRLATAQRRNKLKEEERQRVVKAEAEKKRLEEEAKKRAEEAEAERQRLEEEARQQRIAEAIKQTPITPAVSEFKYDLADGTYGGVKIIKYLGTGMCIKIPEKIEGLAVTEIVTDAFDKNTLVKIVIPGTIKKMMSFRGFTMLSEVTLGNGMAEITGASYKYYEYGYWTNEVDKGVFEGCTNLNKVTIGKGVAAIPERCFAGCTNLSEIIIPNSVTSI